MKPQDYQKKVEENWMTGFTESESLQIALLGLSGEAGEVMEHYKKRLRSRLPVLERNEKALDELGDVLFYVTKIASIQGSTLEELMERNLAKLESRKALYDGKTYREDRA